MSAIPDFSKIAFAPVAPQQERTPRAWLTPEGIVEDSAHGLDPACDHDNRP